MASEQIARLEQARKIVLADPTHYPEIVVGIAPIVNSQCPVEVQRWGSDFLAETFASPIVPGSTKEKMCTEVIPMLKDWLQNQRDEAVLRSAIQTSASIYPYVFRHVTNNTSANQVWEEVTTMKSKILQTWDDSPLGVRICCIKFVQRVVQVQTPGIIADPRRPEQNEISLAIVPREHPIVQLPRLEAEASGLLDRLLSVFQDPASDALIVDATVNCVMVLVRTRQAVSNKIMSAVLSFHPFKNMTAPVSSKEKVRIRSIERTIRAFLLFYVRRNQQSQFQARIQQCIDRNIAARIELEGGQSRKRGAPEPADGSDDAKRQRLGVQLDQTPPYPAMPPPPLTLAQVFTLTNEQTGQFDAKGLSTELVQKITVALLQRIDQGKLAGAINAVRSRVLELEKMAPPASAAAPGDEDDEYEPEFEPTETVEQVMTRLDAAPAAESKEPDDVAEVALGPFKLPQPPPISKEEAEQLAKSSIGRVFSMIESVEQPAKPEKAGMNRLAGTHFDDDAWITLITRLATRAPSNLNKWPGNGEPTTEDDNALAQFGGIAEGIRNTLFNFVITDFRQRLTIAISWLCEEWYNEKVLAKSNGHEQVSPPGSSNYETWTDRILENINPFLDVKDVKFLVRFLSEIPELRPGVFERVKSIAKDPDRAVLAVQSLYYLVLYKPPAKEQALDALEDLYHNYQGAGVHAKKFLAKCRPRSLETENQATKVSEVKQEADSAGMSQFNGATPQSAAESTSPAEGQIVAAAAG